MTGPEQPDDEIEFGAIRESTPDYGLRPDRDPRLCAISCQSPSDKDLPIFIDLDVAHDIYQHAHSDTRVELGGVLMGAVCVDADGAPFVIVSDTIRAEHYEATKGSFKFTHDTWQAISRKRDEYPEGVRMVGWYHTHPDWGVFLSGMDLFICQNFFAGTHDLALVVDPCRNDIGWFQWVPGREQPQRTDGFYLTTSRHREREALEFANQLEGKIPMSFDHRQSLPANSPPVIVQVPTKSSSLSPIEAAFVIGLLLQTVIVAVIAWKMVVTETGQNSREVMVASGPSGANQNDPLSLARQQVIDQLLRDQPDAAELSRELPRLRGEINELTGTISGHERAIAMMSQELAKYEQERGRFEQQALIRTQENRELEEDKQRLQSEVVNTSAELAEIRSQARDAFVWYSDAVYLMALGIAIVLGVVIGVVGGIEWGRRKGLEAPAITKGADLDLGMGASDEST